MMSRARGVVFIFVLVAAFSAIPLHSFAQSADAIQSQIDARKQQVDALQAEIAQYQKQLDVLGQKKNTLQSTISTLTITQKQLAVQIQVTQTQIAQANLQIQQLNLDIGDKEAGIAADEAAIGKALRSLAQDEGSPLISQLISADSLTDAWQTADHAIQFNKALGTNIADLEQTRTKLANNRDQVAAEKAKLVSLNTDLTLQKRSVESNKAQQQQILSQTRNQESNYQKLIAQKQAAERAFESELVNLQSQLNLIVNPGLLPKVGTGVLTWPYKIAFMQQCATRRGLFGNPFCITQYFGDTPFSTANPQIYNGHGHNAIDIASPIGTPVTAALSGRIAGTGNTDVIRGCYSFGKWVMIDHGNGLSTLYSHLSVIDVSPGQFVSTGEVVGLSGMTGYATGPHLHFGVYATQGTKVMTLRQFRGATAGCADATMPVATLTAYLNPLSYL